MALTLEESADLINDLNFKGRVKVAALQYATYLALQPVTSISRTKWVQQTLQSPDAEASRLTPSVVMNVNVQTSGKDTDDTNLAAAVQIVADMMM